MQKVVGSSPIIRFAKPAATGGFFFALSLAPNVGSGGCQHEMSTSHGRERQQMPEPARVPIARSARSANSTAISETAPLTDLWSGRTLDVRQTGRGGSGEVLRQAHAGLGVLGSGAAA